MKKVTLQKAIQMSQKARKRLKASDKNVSLGADETRECDKFGFVSPSKQSPAKFNHIATLDHKR